MGTALRAYLMIRHQGGDWSTSIHRDLSDLTETWDARSRHADAVGLVHVGFTAVDPRGIAAACDPAGAQGGTVWLTAAARYGLPDGFATEDPPIAVVDGIPIFRATGGWAGLGDGHEEPDDSAVSPVSVTAQEGADPPLAAGTNAVVPDHWLAAYLAEHPEQRQLFDQAGIDTDAAFIAQEATLAKPVRTVVGTFRMRALAGERAYDPTVLAGLAPPWLAGHLFTVADLPLKTLNAVRQAGVVTVADLASQTWEGLNEARNVGPRALVLLAEALVSLAEAGPKVTPPSFDTPAESQPEPVTLLDAVRASLADLPERPRLVITARMGLDGDPETLQQVSAALFVTRERVRQIEVKVTKALHGAPWAGSLAERLLRLLVARESPLYLSELAGSDPWFAGVARHPNALAYLLRMFTGGSVRVLDLEGSPFVTTLPKGEWSRTIDRAQAILESGEVIGWTESACRDAVAHLLPVGARELASLLWDVSSGTAHFGPDATGQPVLGAVGRGAEPIVAAVLAEAAEPLHYTEIARRASERAGRPIDERRAHNVLAEIGLLMGRGTFGTERHLPLSATDLRDLADTAAEVILDEGPDRQWHAEELLALLETRDLAPAATTPYLLEIALRRTDTLARVKRFVWQVRSDDQSTGERIHLRETVLTLLRDAGEPLTSTELRKRVAARRGVGRFFQIQPIPPLIRVGPATWGLLDRDVPLTEQARAELLDRTVEALHRAGAGIHISELRERVGLPADVTGEMAVSLAGQDARLRYSRTEYLYPTSWEGPRRLSPAEAVADVLCAAGGPLSFDDIVDRTAAVLGRPCDRVIVSGTFRQVGAERLTDGRWVAGEARDEEDLAGSVSHPAPGT